MSDQYNQQDNATEPPQPQSPQASPPPAQEAETALETNKDAKTWGMLAHLLGVFVGFVAPLVIWLVKKEEHPFVDEQGKEALNFQITVGIASIASSLLMMACIGFFLLPAVMVLNLIFGIMATMAANRGEHYRYPLCLRLIK